MTYNRGVYVNTVSVWNSNTNTYIPLDVEGLEAAGIRDIYLLCRITTSPNYDTILPHVLDDIEGSSLRVWAWFIPSTGYVPTNTTYNAAIYDTIDDILSTYPNVYGVVLDEFRWAGGSSSKSAEQTPNGNIAVTTFHKTAGNNERCCAATYLYAKFFWRTALKTTGRPLVWQTGLRARSLHGKERSASA